MTMLVEGDIRGWVLTIASGIACAFGSCIICVDLIAQKCLGKDFHISRSKYFLSRSLSLSAGVMLFTSLYHLLPESRSYLVRAGATHSIAALYVCLFFFGGVISIYGLSALANALLPSWIVEPFHCHTRGINHHLDDHHHSDAHGDSSHDGNDAEATLLGDPQRREEETLISRRNSEDESHSGGSTMVADDNPDLLDDNHNHETYTPHARKFSPSQHKQQHSQYGSTEPVESRSTTATNPDIASPLMHRQKHQFHEPHQHKNDHRHPHHSHHHQHPQHQYQNQNHHHQEMEEDTEQTLHNSFGLQLCIAILLHKLPEGFITLAANHANARLGITVFVSLFIHNICEGFAMALPLFLSMRSRAKAIGVTSVLGGVSQLLGAAVAAVWLRHRSEGGPEPPGSGSFGAYHSGGDMAEIGQRTAILYGVMFSITSGIMANIGLHMFGEATFSLHHSDGCVLFAIGGMGLLGIAQALME